MKEPEMAIIAELIAEALRGRADANAVAAVRQRVAALCAKFPVYPNPF
jgi:glycine/serine hydroxymethyltransferase